ncbi:cytochrome c oxidase assembly protein COX20, mitochondrial [Culicoides brevitarsis]|uniref:cytochrome c oxidase assembly protein COX20, mitochondrial n=1 Tax=Culicoides brevitarsis TaxID=469753 RepID=UPI00307B6826
MSMDLKVDNPVPVKDITDEEEDLPKRSLYIFGTDVSQIPCFRSSWLYGISGGIGIGLITFMRTSRGNFSWNVGVGSLCAITVAYWIPCRYLYSKSAIEYAKLQKGIRAAAVYEGSALEKEVMEKSEDV